MLRLLAVLAVLAVLPFPAFAQSAISSEIAQRGLAATEARLAALPAPDDRERFALGGVRFLRGVERALQLRWRQGFRQAMMVPVLRLPIPENPNPAPMRPEVIRELFTGIDGDMTAARAALGPIPETSDFGLEVRLADLWFDIDGNGKRSDGESLYKVVGPALFSRRGFDPTRLSDLVVRFDVADSRWLMAYASLLDALSQAVLTYDPTAAIGAVLDADARLKTLNQGLDFDNALSVTVGGFADILAVVVRALRQTPDKAHAAAAHAALLQMIADNRAFWRLVRAETDDNHEWVPNDSQRSALGLTVPKGTGDAWLAVLADAEQALQGKLMIPYWRLGNGAGLNLRTMFLQPGPIDLADWIQGIGALPYAERGPRISAANWRMFDRLVQGNSMLFAAFLN